MNYHQFCPISKAMEVLGERWTLLLVRELIMGGKRFNELQRGLGTMSPSLLTKRLVAMEEQGLVIKKRIPGQRGYEYFPTEACRDLMPVIEQVGIWGMRWARNQMQDDDYDLELLMLYLERSIVPENLPGNESVIKFQFRDISEFSNWWLVIKDKQTEVCVRDPGKEVDVYFNVGLKTMCQLMMGDISYRKAIASGQLQLIGQSSLTKRVEDWMKPSLFAGIPPANAILQGAV